MSKPGGDMGERLEQEQRTGLSPEQIAALSGLKIAVRPAVWGFWKDALNEDAPETVEVKLARVDFDADGVPEAVGFRYSEMSRAIEEHGNPNSPEAQLVGLQPERIYMLTPDGQDMYPPIRPMSELKEPPIGDIFDSPYI